MRLALIADTFPPLRNSGAVQLRDLSREFARQGHQLTVMLPSADIDRPWQIEDFDGAQVLRLKAPRTKDIGYVRRTLAELAMPYAMLRNLRKSPLAKERWDGVIWYSPSIFHGPLVKALRRDAGCKSYLIIRDIFPEWAVDMGLMGRGLPYRFFDAIARYQYSVADVIGVQTPGNLGYFDQWRKQPHRSLEVLQNWLGEPAHNKCPIRIDQTKLAGRKIFVYAGNIGIAQGLDIFIDLADQMRTRSDIGFVFVGRGSEVGRLKALSNERGLENTLFFDEIDPDEVMDLYAQCSVGIVSLDQRHRSHNIPGKFLTYMQGGLPVIAFINKGNDLAGMIRSECVGEACENDDISELCASAERIIENSDCDYSFKEKCQQLFLANFSARAAVEQIIRSFN